MSKKEVYKPYNLSIWRHFPKVDDYPECWWLYLNNGRILHRTKKVGCEPFFWVGDEVENIDGFKVIESDKDLNDLIDLNGGIKFSDIACNKNVLESINCMSKFLSSEYLDIELFDSVDDLYIDTDGDIIYEYIYSNGSRYSIIFGKDQNFYCNSINGDDSKKLKTSDIQEVILFIKNFKKDYKVLK